MKLTEIEEPATSGGNCKGGSCQAVALQAVALQVIDVAFQRCQDVFPERSKVPGKLRERDKGLSEEVMVVEREGSVSSLLSLRPLPLPQQTLSTPEASTAASHCM